MKGKIQGYGSWVKPAPASLPSNASIGGSKQGGQGSEGRGQRAKTLRSMHYALCVILITVFTGCAGPQQEVQQQKPDEKVLTDKLPHKVAVLPFGNETEEIGVSGQVRKSFSNHFSSKPYIKIDPSVVDAKVAELEKNTGKTILEIPSKEAADAIGVDGLVYGKVTDYKKIYAVAYSQIGVEAEVWMVNTKTGEEVWRFKEAVRYHEGGVSLSPIGLVMTAVSTAMNIREIQRIRVINELGWKINEKVPAPAGLKVAANPVIKNALSNAKEGAFGSGKVFKVAMEGEAGLIGLFEIGGFKKGLAMKEINPGEYLGEYAAAPGDNIKDAPVVVYLRRPTGEESKWHDVSGLVVIDTTAPQRTEGLKGRAFIDRIELSWNKVSANDLAGYKVMRSIKPLSGYEEKGFIEEDKFIDKDMKPGEAYYYYVAAVDMAKNEGEHSETVNLTLRQKEPVALKGSIKSDKTLSAGTYILGGDVVVDKGVVLKIEPDTKLLFEKDASLKISGSLTVSGKDGMWVEFLPKSPDLTWRGIIIDGGEATISYAKISGAKAGLTALKTGARVSNTIIEGNETGLLTSGTPSPNISKTVIWQNQTGVVMDSAQTVIEKSDIAQNKTGIQIKKSSPTIKENNIHDNEINIDAGDAAVNADGNYFGTITFEEMRFKGGVKAISVLDKKYPEGKPVQAVVNPYASLSPEEKKQKVAELLVSSGRYFRERNFGKAVSIFEEVLKLEENPTTYYYTALSYQGMEDNEKALQFLKKGVEKFPLDANISKAYGLLLYQIGKDDEAKKAMKEALRLNPGDKQVKFLLERLEGK
ncbi:MAG TPA: hypothetical protein DD641_00675 [Deltaproteobacteria bacterium]|nr:hypothetical protein [Deltaproteobacteria bacterium]